MVHDYPYCSPLPCPFPLTQRKNQWNKPRDPSWKDAHSHPNLILSLSVQNLPDEPSRRESSLLRTADTELCLWREMLLTQELGWERSIL